ncbi:hypothetical protein CYMTET_24496, partial [Cymbomonas tetramitiformis]
AAEAQKLFLQARQLPGSQTLMGAGPALLERQGTPVTVSAPEPAREKASQSEAEAKQLVALPAHEVATPTPEAAARMGAKAGGVQYAMGSALVQPGAAAAERFGCAEPTTTGHREVKAALRMRRLQRMTQMGKCTIVELRRSFLAGARNKAIVEQAVDGDGHRPDLSITIEELERRFRIVLRQLPADAFQEAVGVLTERVVCAMDPTWWLGGVQWPAVVAALALLCHGNLDTRLRLAFEALLFSATGSPVAMDGSPSVPSAMASQHIRYLKSVLDAPLDGSLQLVPSPSSSAEPVDLHKYKSMLQKAFPFLVLVERLEQVEHTPQSMACSVCAGAVQGPYFTCLNVYPKFSLCCHCYASGMIPVRFQGHQSFIFREHMEEPIAGRFFKFVTGWR